VPTLKTPKRRVQSSSSSRSSSPVIVRETVVTNDPLTAAVKVTTDAAIGVGESLEDLTEATITGTEGAVPVTNYQGQNPF
jgi:hypothetical protein